MSTKGSTNIDVQNEREHGHEIKGPDLPARVEAHGSLIWVVQPAAHKQVLHGEQAKPAQAVRLHKQRASSRQRAKSCRAQTGRMQYYATALVSPHPSDDPDMGSNNRNRRWAAGVGTAVGAAFAAALIGLANAPAANADNEVLPSDDLGNSGANPFEDLFGNSGINTWTTSADSFLASNDPTLAANLDTSVDNFLFNFGNQVDPFSTIAYRLDPSLPPDQLPFSMDPAGFGYFLDDGVPLNATGDFALGLDYISYASGIGATLDPIIYLFLDPFLYGPL
jgi:hypothetical protein